MYFNSASLNHDDGFMPVILNSKPQMIISSFDQFLEYLLKSIEEISTGKDSTSFISTNVKLRKLLRFDALLTVT